MVPRAPVKHCAHRGVDQLTSLSNKVDRGNEPVPCTLALVQ